MWTRPMAHPALLQSAIDVEDRFLDSDVDPLGPELVRGDVHWRSWGRIVRGRALKEQGKPVLRFLVFDDGGDEQKMK